MVCGGHLVCERRDLLRIQDHLPEEADEQRAPSLRKNNSLFTGVQDTQRYGSGSKILMKNYVSFDVFFLLLTVSTFPSVLQTQRLHVIKKSQNCRNQGFSKIFSLLMEVSGSGSVQITTDPDPWGPKKNLRILYRPGTGIAFFTPKTFSHVALALARSTCAFGKS
jgi:hypothetical protein